MENMNSGTGHGGRQLTLTFKSTNPECLGEPYDVIVELPEDENRLQDWLIDTKDTSTLVRVFMDDDYDEITDSLSVEQWKEVLTAIRIFLIENPIRKDVIQ